MVADAAKVDNVPKAERAATPKNYSGEGRKRPKAPLPPGMQQLLNKHGGKIPGKKPGGTMGLTAVGAVRRFTGADAIIVGARYPHQRKWAEVLGADLVVDPDEVPRAVRRAAGTRVIGSTLGSGVDVTIDAVGSSSSLTDAISITRPRGRVVLLGMPAEVNLNLTALWHRETALVGAYCYGSEHSHGGAHTFSLAEELVREHDLGQLVSAIYPLADYREAIEHAAQAGPRGSVKIAFDLRETPEA